MRAGFAREKITPPIGTHMLGFGNRDTEKGCEAIHDDLYVHALFLEYGDEKAVILSYDLCFVSRDLADRFRGCVARTFDVRPRQILLNFSHTHAGPCTANWGFSGHKQMIDPLYLDDVGDATVRAVKAASASARAAKVWAGQTTTRLPLSRRKPDGKGGVEWRPYPEGTVCNTLPLSLFKDQAGKPICLLYSVSCHPSTIGGWHISADYPGVASELINQHLGFADGGAMFLQGCAGDTKPCVVGNGRDAVDVSWRGGTWEDVSRAGQIVADEVIAGMRDGLSETPAALRTWEIEMQWPLATPPARAELEKYAGSNQPLLRRLWAQRMLRILERHGALDADAPILMQGIKIGEGLRIVGLEGEAVAGLGILIREFYSRGITFPLGYIHGTQLYLPTDAMIPEKGYEVDSYFEYGFPAPLVPGLEAILLRSLTELKHHAID